MDEYLEQLDSCAWVSLPFAATRLRVVTESFSVIGGINHPTPATHLLNYLTDTPDDPILVTDCLHQGPQSLYFAQLGDTDMVESWLRKMTNPCIYVNTRRGDTLVAAPASAFAPL